MNTNSFSLRVGIGSTIALIVCVAGLVLGTTTLKIGKKYFRENLRTKIEGVALTAATLVTPNSHKSLKAAADEKSDNYRQLVDLFRKIKKSNPEVRFIYSLREGEDGVPVFIIDAEEDPTKVSHLGDKYPEASQPILDFLKNPKRVSVDEEFSSDQWGTFLSGYASIGEPGNYDGLVGVDVSADYVMKAESQIRTIVLIGTTATVIASAILGFLFASRLTKPLGLLTDEVKRIENLDLNDRPRVKSAIMEIDQLAIATEGMKRGITSFKKYVPSDVVTDLLLTKQEAKLGTERKQITVFFADIADFTTISENLSSERLASLMDQYLGTVTNVIKKNGGTVDKFIGDAVMAFWGAPHENPKHADSACRAALDCQKALHELNKRLNEQGFEDVVTRIGINSGEAIVGNIGTEDRMSYTAIGDTVNLASRVEGINKDYGTKILICDSTKAKLTGSFVSRIVDRVIVKGKTQAVGLHELIEAEEVINIQTWELVKKHNEAMAAYIAGNFEEAKTKMTTLLSIEPTNNVIKTHLENIINSIGSNGEKSDFRPRKMTSK